MKYGDAAPRFLNLLRIALPVTAVLSIGHRITGVLLSLAIPGMIYLLGLSLSGPAAFERAAHAFDAEGVRVACALAVWAFAHHAFAGVRFLLLDLRVGIDRPTARASAWAVNLGGIAMLFLALIALL